MTKEQYLKIIKNWKDFIKNNKHKKYKVDDHRFSYSTRSIDVCGYHWESDLKSYHHLIYALLRNKDLNKSFSEKCITELSWNLKRWIKLGIEKEPASLLAPFGESFTYDMLKELINKLPS